MVKVDYVIPLWQIIVSILAIIAAFYKVTSISIYNTKEIKALKNNNKIMEDSNKAMFVEIDLSNKVVIKELKDDIHSQNKSIEALKKDIEEKLDKYKIATDVRLSSINDGVVETRTLVKLLVEDKIKKG